ncbi:ABC transporter ATP-binding protein [Variovorax sp. GB1P17]|uniref:ABC transporter ATP-binding protein n=1 Tax=Variovorax sp. GB1P17 TaxID=3443740 RepID=UPI003F45BEBA
MTATSASPLELRSVVTGYGDIPVLKSATMAFSPGALTTIIGSNGAGKSTAIKAATGLLRCWEGSIWAGGVDITAEPAYTRISRGIAYVPQGRIVVPEMTVADNLAVGAHTLHGKRAVIEEALDRVTTLFPVLAQRMKQAAGTMSGGEQQMLAIGRALMTSPKVILLDEPSLGLSPKYVEIVFERLLTLRSQGMTTVMVEQKASRALNVSDFGYVMHLGRVAYMGRASDLLDNENVKRIFLGELPEGEEFALEEQGNA